MRENLSAYNIFVANFQIYLHSRKCPALVYAILVIWTWSMLQFPLDLAGVPIFTQRNIQFQFFFINSINAKQESDSFVGLVIL